MAHPQSGNDTPRTWTDALSRFPPLPGTYPTRKDHRVQSTVELTVAATGKAVTGLRLTRCRLERCDTGEASKGRLVSAATRV